MFFRRKSFRNLSNFSSGHSKILYILSAVRTPIVLPNGVLKQFTAPQLFSFAFKEALQRAAVPTEDVLNVFLSCSSNYSYHENFLRLLGLSKTTKISSVSTCGLRSFINGAQFLLTGNQNICVVGGTVTASNYTESANDNAEKTIKHFLSKQNTFEELVEFDHKNFKNSQKNGEFYDEIATINFRKRGEQLTITEDELPRRDLKNFKEMHELKTNFEDSLRLADGAAALVIATEDYVQKNNLIPLAKIVSFAEKSVESDNFLHSQLLAIEKALEVGGCQCRDISQWELDSAGSDMYSGFLSHFKVNSSAVNKSGGALTLGYPIGLSGTRALCHLSHSLSFGNLGCVASCDFSGTTYALIIKKFYAKCCGKPRLTLFTKKPCPLCDELKEQLKPFEERFLLREVDIEAEGNEKYKQLYKYEIPVLFLEGRFLCKHKLQPEHFNRRLSELENFS